MNLKIAIITVSDRASAGIYNDESGPAAEKALRNAFESRELTAERSIVPDDPAKLKEALQGYVSRGFDFIFTTGGTGIGPRDITPEVTAELVEKEIPGIGEAMRAFSMQITKNAMLSRATAGLCGKTIVINLPGSPKAVTEIIEFLADVLAHSQAMIRGEDTHQ